MIEDLEYKFEGASCFQAHYNGSITNLLINSNDLGQSFMLFHYLVILISLMPLITLKE